MSLVISSGLSGHQGQCNSLTNKILLGWRQCEVALSEARSILFALRNKVFLVFGCHLDRLPGRGDCDSPVINLDQGYGCDFALLDHAIASCLNTEQKLLTRGSRTQFRLLQVRRAPSVQGL
jgi:hypothetical protein